LHIEPRGISELRLQALHLGDEFGDCFTGGGDKFGVGSKRGYLIVIVRYHPANDHVARLVVMHRNALPIGILIVLPNFGHPLTRYGPR